MTDLFEQVLHHLEGAETEIQNWQTVDGIKTVEFQSFGPDRWIESVHENGRMIVLDCLALILFAVDKSFDIEQARRIVEGWAVELRRAATAGEIKARDPVTLLALETPPEGWEWLLSMTDADKFTTSRGMDWVFADIVSHLFKECEKAIQERRFPPWTRTAQTTATPAPVVALVETTKAGPVANWKMQIQTEATALCLRLRNLGANPTRNSILDSMAMWCRDNNIRTDTKINPSANYLRTHVLGGKHWDVPN